MVYAAVNGLNTYHEVHGDGPPLRLLRGVWHARATPERRRCAPQLHGTGPPASSTAPPRPTNSHAYQLSPR
jgi:hypothetical protein